MFRVCFTPRRGEWSSAKGNWWRPISISLCRPPEVTSALSPNWINAIEMSIRGFLLRRDLNLSSERKSSLEFLSQRNRIPVGVPHESSRLLSENFFHCRSKVQTPKSQRRVCCYISDRISLSDNLYWQRVYLLYVPYRTPAATASLSRQYFAMCWTRAKSPTNSLCHMSE